MSGMREAAKAENSFVKQVKKDSLNQDTLKQSRNKLNSIGSNHTSFI